MKPILLILALFAFSQLSVAGVNTICMQPGTIIGITIPDDIQLKTHDEVDVAVDVINGELIAVAEKDGFVFEVHGSDFEGELRSVGPFNTNFLFEATHEEGLVQNLTVVVTKNDVPVSVKKPVNIEVRSDSSECFN